MLDGFVAFANGFLASALWPIAREGIAKQIAIKLVKMHVTTVRIVLSLWSVKTHTPEERQSGRLEPAPIVHFPCEFRGKISTQCKHWNSD